MTPPQDIYEQFAVLLDYPTGETGTVLEACIAGLRRSCPAAAEHLVILRDYLQESCVERAQEVYTQTFDLNPVCTLGVGYYLFGEDYQRGVFLARLRESQDEVGVEAGGELPDHLPVVLRWLGRVYGSDEYTDMVGECVLPALGKMDEGLAESANPYRGVLQAVRMVLERDLTAEGRVARAAIPSSAPPSLS